jgi:hypothetical protein
MDFLFIPSRFPAVAVLDSDDVVFADVFAALNLMIQEGLARFRACACGLGNIDDSFLVQDNPVSAMVTFAAPVTTTSVRACDNASAC